MGKPINIKEPEKELRFTRSRQAITFVVAGFSSLCIIGFLWFKVYFNVLETAQTGSLVFPILISIALFILGTLFLFYPYTLATRTHTPGASMALSGMGECGAEEDCLHSHLQHQHQQQHQRRGTGSSGLHTRARDPNLPHARSRSKQQPGSWRSGRSVFVDRSIYDTFVGTYY